MFLSNLAGAGWTYWKFLKAEIGCPPKRQKSLRWTAAASILTELPPTMTALTAWGQKPWPVPQFQLSLWCGLPTLQTSLTSSNNHVAIPCNQLHVCPHSIHINYVHTHSLLILLSKGWILKMSETKRLQIAILLFQIYKSKFGIKKI